MKIIWSISDIYVYIYMNDIKSVTIPQITSLLFHSDIIITSLTSTRSTNAPSVSYSCIFSILKIKNIYTQKCGLATF